MSLESTQPSDPARSQTTEERRSSTRRASRGPLRLLVPSAELEGMMENASQGGVLFTTSEQLEVEIELERDGEVLRRRGRLVRAVRMDGTTTAWAVEFV
jgi:hypothetical protein